MNVVSNAHLKISFPNVVLDLQLKCCHGSLAIINHTLLAKALTLQYYAMIIVLL